MLTSALCDFVCCCCDIGWLQRPVLRLQPSIYDKYKLSHKHSHLHTNAYIFKTKATVVVVLRYKLL